MKWVLFATGVVAGVALVLWVVVSAVRPERRLWPPGERDWRFYCHWGLDVVYNLSLLGVAYLDWGSLWFPRPASLVVGVLLFVGGGALGVVAGRDLGERETLGLDGDLRTGGFYRYSRNPQYVGYAVATVGAMLAADSWLVLALGTVRLVHWLALPFAEEPWLRERHGAAYEAYREAVPRFVGVETVRRLLARK